MIGTKKWIRIKNETSDDCGFREFMCYNFSDRYYKFVCIEKRCSMRFVKIPIIANIAGDYVHQNTWIPDQDEPKRASP
tara:strand:+ start:983 stop:1216 length:234 start_codon:yes stop_codon:yes gene_type:complete